MGTQKSQVLTSPPVWGWFQPYHWCHWSWALSFSPFDNLWQGEPLLQATFENISRTSQVDLGCLRPGLQLHFHGYLRYIAQSQVLSWHRDHYNTEFFSLFSLLNVQILEGRTTPTKRVRHILQWGLKSAQKGNCILFSCSLGECTDT